MQRFFKWFGIGVGALFVAIPFLLGIPQTFFSQMFPTKTYDHVEVVLEIDDERVVVRGTALCVKVTGYLPSSSPVRSHVTQLGGAAATTMSDGRVVVIPYTQQDYCHGVLGADGYFDGWWKVFDQRFSLGGNIKILIMDDGDHPSEMEMIVGPGYFRNPDASIKLISADRWRSESGKETSSDLWWFNYKGRRPSDTRWMGTYVLVLESASQDQNPRLDKLQDYVRSNPDRHDPPKAPNGNWAREIARDTRTVMWPADLAGDEVFWDAGGEPFRVPMILRPSNWYPSHQTATRYGGCGSLSGPNLWSGQGQKLFYFDDKQLDAVPVGSSPNEGTFLYMEKILGTLIVGGKFCVNPHRNVAVDGTLRRAR